MILGLLPSITSLYPLNINRVFRAKDSIGLAVSLAFPNLIRFNSINALSLKINISFIYIIIISNKPFLFRVINKHGSNINVSINSLSL